jgi:AcrR family transcriptional regulator
MVYRRTEKVVRRLAQRHAAILAAARAAADEGGMAAVQIAPVADRAGIAAGTVYRYFPAKSDLVAALVATVADREIAELRQAADAAPGPLSAIAAAVTTFAARGLARRKLAWAVLAEPVDPEVEGVRLGYRQALAAELEQRIATAMSCQQLPTQDATLSAAALVGGLLEAVIGPLAPRAAAAHSREAVQSITLIALRAVGVADAHARGLVMQTAVPMTDEGGQRTEDGSQPPNATSAPVPSST